MKRSRIICSIVTVIYIMLSVALILILMKNCVTMDSSVTVYLKAIHIAIFGICTLMYVFVKKKLATKMSGKAISIKVSKIYYYMYLAAITFVTRFAMAYSLKDSVVLNVVPSLDKGVGSYINYGLSLFLDNPMYANVIINTMLTFTACVLIKKIMLNITENDTVASMTSIVYLLIPQSLVFVTEYIKYNYNVIFVLLGILLLTKIIDETKNFNKKNNKYLVYAVVLGIVQSIDVILGGSYVLWFITLVVTTVAAMYIDIVHISIWFKNKLNYKLKILAEKVERINISKLVAVTVVSLGISSITLFIYILASKANNYQIFSVDNAINILMHSRNYYLVLIIISLVFEILGVILRRNLDIKMFMIKIAFIVSGVTTFFMLDGIHASALFDTLLILTLITNICSICYNREEKVKLLKEKN